MDKKILEQLEFDKVKEQFRAYLQTEQGNRELDQLEPLNHHDKIKHYFLEIEEMAGIFVEQHHFALGSLSDISASMRRLELEADLSIPELLAVKKILQVSAEASRFYVDLENVQLQALKRLFENLSFFLAFKAVFRLLMTVVLWKVLPVPS